MARVGRILKLCVACGQGIQIIQKYQKGHVKVNHLAFTDSIILRSTTQDPEMPASPLDQNIMEKFPTFVHN